MTAAQLRQQLHQRIDHLPDEIVKQIADFTAFMIAQNKLPLAYEDWPTRYWQDFALDQFFRDEDLDEDAVEYTLQDAQEIYHS